MKKKYRCHMCKKVNEFETKGLQGRVELSESHGAGTQGTTVSYILSCDHCGAENTVEVTYGQSGR
jgi:hypothetical protein